MDKEAEKDIRDTLTEDYEEIKKSIEEALSEAGLEVVYIDCNIAIREGYSIFLNVKRRKVNKSVNQKSIGDKHWQLPEEGNW